MSDETNTVRKGDPGDLRGGVSKRALDIFGAALELNPAEIKAFVDRECGEDAALDAEVKRLFAADRRSDILFPP